MRPEITSDCPTHLWGFPKGGFCEGGKSQSLRWVRAPFAIINFAFFVRELLVESYTNSEIFAGS